MILLGFHTKRVYVDAERFSRSDTIELVIQMAVKTELLGTVDVLEKNGYIFYQPERVSVLDYTVNSSGVLVLQKRTGGRELCLLNSEANVVCDKKITFNASNLLQDCLGNSYLLHKDSMRLISFSHDSLIIADAISRLRYNSSILPCMASNSQNLYFQFGNKYYLTFTQSDHFSASAKPLYSVYDLDDNLSLLEYLYDAKAMEKVDANKAYDMRMWYQKILTRNLNGLILATDTGAAILDMTKDTVIYFSMSGDLVKSVYTELHQKNGFTGHLLKDVETGHHYALYENKGLVRLEKLNSGLSTSASYTLDQTTFPRQIALWNDSMYFLQYDSSDKDRTKLFRMNLQ